MEMNRVRWLDAGDGAAGSCAAFLARHTDYRDGNLSPLLAAQHAAHAARCDSCARYARVLERGVDVLRNVSEVEPSEEFAARLQHRLFHLEDGALRPRRRYAPGLAAAAALGTLLLLPQLRAPAVDRGAGIGTHLHEDVFGRRAELWQPLSLPLAQAGRVPGALPVALYSPVIVRAPTYQGGALAHAD